MDIDMSALQMLEREKGISVEVVVDAIETALLSAYHKSPGAHQVARVELNRSSGHVTVWAKERLEPEPTTEPEPTSEEDAEGTGDTEADAPEVQVAEPTPPAPRFTEEFDHTPEDFGHARATGQGFAHSPELGQTAVRSRGS
jgi:N utilization substance protein A